MQGYEWLLYANVAVWLGIGGYIFIIARFQQRLEQRLRQMEIMHDD